MRGGVHAAHADSVLQHPARCFGLPAWESRPRPLPPPRRGYGNRRLVKRQSEGKEASKPTELRTGGTRLRCGLGQGPRTCPEERVPGQRRPVRSAETWQGRASGRSTAARGVREGHSAGRASASVKELD